MSQLTESLTLQKLVYPPGEDVTWWCTQVDTAASTTPARAALAKSQVAHTSGSSHGSGAAAG